MNFIDSLQVVGNGGLVDVEDNCLIVRPKSRFQVANEKGDAYCWACLTQNYEAGDTMIGLINSETTRSLYVERIVVSTATTSQMIVFGTSAVGTPAGDTAIVGVCLNRNFNRAPQTVCYDDETGQDIAASSWPTRYAGALVLAGQTVGLYFGGKIVLGSTHFIGVDAVNDIAAGNVSIWGWFE